MFGNPIVRAPGSPFEAFQGLFSAGLAEVQMSAQDRLTAEIRRAIKPRRPIDQQQAAAATIPYNNNALNADGERSIDSILGKGITKGNLIVAGAIGLGALLLVMVKLK